MGIIDKPVSIQTLDCGESILTCSGVTFKANSATVALLASLQDGTSLPDAYSKYVSNSIGPRIDIETYRILAERLIDRLREPSTEQTKMGFPWLWARFKLLPANVCRLIVLPVRWIYQLRVFPIVLCMTIGILAFFITMQWGTQFKELRQQPFSTHLLLAMFSLLVHEFGHVAACEAFGIKHKGVQCGMMLFFPATFVELGEVWKVRTQERIIVNFGGSFMQFFVASLALSANVLMQSPTMVAFAYLSIFLGLIQLIPIRNSDGYWILLDLFHNGSDQIFSFQNSLVIKAEMSSKEEWTRHLLAFAFLIFSVALLYLSYDYARLAVAEIQAWISVVSTAGWSSSDLGMIKLKHLYRLFTFSLGSIIVSFLIWRYFRK